MPETTNPKDLLARAEDKVRLDLLEPAANRKVARAMAFGAIGKGYGVRNFIAPGNAISLRTYIAATMRHLDAILEGEDDASDSGIDHWGHIGANVHVVLAAKAAGTLVDDRDPQLREAEDVLAAVA